MNKKEFALKAIAPYYKNPDICGYDSINDSCRYLTADGRKCVLGKYLLHPEHKENMNADNIVSDKSQEDILIPEAVDILTPEEWLGLQRIHDGIALKFSNEKINCAIDKLGLFTFGELIEAVK